MLAPQGQKAATFGLGAPDARFGKGTSFGAKPTRLPPVVGAGRGRKLPPVQGLRKAPGPMGFQPLGSLVPLGQASTTLVPAAAPEAPAESEHFIKHQDTQELQDFLKHY